MNMSAVNNENTNSKEEAKALLKYMLDHNKHHAAELAELAGQFDDAAGAVVQAAVKDLISSNEKLDLALYLLEKGEN